MSLLGVFGCLNYTAWTINTGKLLQKIESQNINLRSCAFTYTLFCKYFLHKYFRNYFKSENGFMYADHAISIGNFWLNIPEAPYS